MRHDSGVLQSDAYWDSTLHTVSQAALMPKTPGQNAPPFDIQKAIQMAVRFHWQGALEEAERIYKSVLKADRSHADALHLLGVLQGQQNRPAIAVELISLALKQKPGSAEAHSNLGLALAALNRHAEAIANFDKALAIKPNDAGALKHRGITLAGLHRHEEAIASSRASQLRQ